MGGQTVAAFLLISVSISIIIITISNSRSNWFVLVGMPNMWILKIIFVCASKMKIVRAVKVKFFHEKSWWKLHLKTKQVFVKITTELISLIALMLTIMSSIHIGSLIQQGPHLIVWASSSTSLRTQLTQQLSGNFN